MRIITRESVKAIASDLNDDGLECRGMDTFGLGIGHCTTADTPRSKCKADEYWGWGSTYGSRVILLPTVPLSRGPSPSLVCATTKG